MDLFRQLYLYGQRVGFRTTQDIRGHYYLDIDKRRFVKADKGTTQAVPLRLKRGADGAKIANYGFDMAKYVCNARSVFYVTLDEILTATGDKAVQRAVRDYLAHPAERPASLRDGDTVVLRLGGQPLVERPAVRSWCDAMLAPTNDVADDFDGVCLVTGERALMARTHDTVLNLGGSGKNVRLFSVNQGAMRYYGADQGHNFPTARRVSRYYAQGMSYALDSGLHVDRTTSIAIWPDDDTAHPLTAHARTILTQWLPTTEMLTAAWDGIAAHDPADATILHLLLVGKHDSRASVRRYVTLPAAALRANLLRFLAEFSAVRRRPSFRAVSPGRVISPNDPPRLPPGIHQDVLWAVLTGTPYPLTLRSLLAQTRPTTDQEYVRLASWIAALSDRTSPKHEETPMIDFERRDGESETDRRMREVNAHVHPDRTTSLAYQWGRYVACFCLLRRTASGWQIPDWFTPVLFGCEHPRSFLPTNAARYEAFLAKHRKKGWDIVLAHVAEGLLADIGALPERFTTEQKSQVHLGARHQIAGYEAYRRRRMGVPKPADTTASHASPAPTNMIAKGE